MLSDSFLRWTRSSTSAATTVFVVLPGTNRVLEVARRPEARSITPLAPDHTSRPQRVTAPVAAGAPVDWRPSVSAAPSCCASVLAVAAGGAARHNRQPTTALATLREDAWDQDSGRIGDLLFAVPGPGAPALGRSDRGRSTTRSGPLSRTWRPYAATRVTVKFRDQCARDA